MIRSNFLNEVTYKDDLQLEQGLEQTFRKKSSKGAAAWVIYVDVNQYPNAYSLGGFYHTGGDQMTIKLKLFKGRESVDLEIPPAANVEDLLAGILWEVEGKVLEWEER